ncbi:MAG: MaoC family dehydratase [Chloroflexi bacterium]|nr:MaoC family dehydratase [Chloroflexota bacterium]MBV9544918.1 MaoC family dehydratase [Chloroflexota bacterium]
MPPRYFEDFESLVGHTIELGTCEFTSDSITAFAREYDPQPMHTDPERAKTSIYGGLIASGWQTAVTYMRMLVDRLVNGTESLGSPGLDSLRWLRPVRPGDTLLARFTILETRSSRSRPDRGIVRSRGEMLNQHGEVVMDVEAVNFFGRRPQGD